MRVLYCTDTYLPQVNGVTVVTDVSARGMIERGWEVEVVGPRYPRTALGVRDDVFAASPPSPAVTSVASIRAPRYPELRIAAPDVVAIGRTFDRFKPDLVHAATEFVVGRVGMWAAERRGIPVVTSYHTHFTKYAELYGLRTIAPLIGRYIAAMHKRAWRTYTPSSAARAELWRSGVPDVVVWGRGVDATQFSPERRSAALRTRLGVRQAFTFLYVGRLAREKSVRVILDAFRRLTACIGRDAVRLVIAGSGPDEAALREAAPQGTVFLGNLDRVRELPELYATADAFAFASETETLGLVLLEAMASGLPVVAIPAGGVTDTLVHDRNGLAVRAGSADAFADAMLSLVTNPALCGRLASGALATGRAADWRVELDALDRDYRRICADASRVREMPMGLGLRRL